MSRDDERKKQANLRRKDFSFLNELHSNEQIQIFVYDRFLEGAEWADQHPRKGLWDAEKVIEWLKRNCTYTHPRKGTEECFIDLFALKDAMENQIIPN